MYFRLALALGKTIGELDRVMSRSEFAEWCAFYSFEPWGCEGDDQRWRQHYSLMWAANFKGDAPDFLDRYPRDEIDEIDPFEAMLESRWRASAE